MRPFRHSTVLGAVALLAAACIARPTEVTTLYLDPAQPAEPFRKTLAVFIGDDAELRRRMEDRLARRLPNTVASHTLIPDNPPYDVERIRRELVSAGFDGAIVLNLVSVEGTGALTSQPSSTPSQNLWEYLRQTPRSAIKPGEQTVITMGSRAYSVSDGRLLWAGRSESFNPLSIRELVNMLVDSAIAEIREKTQPY